MTFIGGRRTTAVRRRYLISLSAMGLLVCVLGSTGLFAALSDTARTGQNTIDSAPLAGSAELKIQAGSVVPGPTVGSNAIACSSASWVDDLTTGGFNATDVGPGFSTPNAYYCIQNAGSQAVQLVGNTDSIVNVENGCTGDEELLGDTSCGVGVGELGDVISVRWISVDCLSLNESGQADRGMFDNEATPVALGSIAPGEIRCFAVGAYYLAATPADAVQRAQSDQIQWRFKFTGTVL
jgi:hypothetical protein